MSKETNIHRILTALSPKEFLSTFWAGLNAWWKGNGRNIRHTAIYFLLTVFSVFAVVMVFVFVELLDQYETMQEQQASIQKVLNYWQRVLKTENSSPDIYLQAAVTAYQLGDRGLAYQYVNKALFLDPNFDRAQDLKHKIENE